jgi:predicted MPP superfamily phosphohydrolase
MIMLPPLPLVTSLAMSTALVVGGAGVARLFFPRALHGARGKALFALFAIAIGASHAMWALGPRAYALSAMGASFASMLLPPLTLVVASLPLAALARALVARALRVRDPSPDASPPAPTAITRRAVVTGAAATVPLLALGTGVAGFAGDKGTLLRRVPMRFADLPSALDGLRILQLSDLHLGCSKGLPDLERFLDRLPEAPDLLVLTGDIAEDVALLAPALRLASQLRPRLGAFAVLGNHEYLHDIRVTRPILDRGPVPLLVGAGHTIDVAGARLHLAGADDPVSVGQPISAFMERTVDRALDGAPSGAFHLLLAHRPEGFDAAARRGVDLTLSGHTHGGQIGYDAKSAFEPLYPDGYLWGPYARGRSRLYTTSGFGDWYPFRIGCPTEGALVVLERATPASCR